MEPSYESAVALACRAAGPLAGDLDPFVASLIDQQYAASVVHIKARHAVSFDRWLAKQGVVLADLGEIHIEQYQRRRRRRHHCICAETRRREGYEVTALLGFLRTRGVCEAAQANSTPAEDLAAGFGQHLQDQQGLAAATIARYTTVARQFLTERGNVDLRALRAFEIIEFVQRQARRMQAPALKCVVTGMRSFLRYAQYCGKVAPELVAAVPAVATWATTPRLPKAISPEHAQRAIDSCDLSTAIGQRDRAVLLLLARLGLRAHEIIALTLEDCDWDAGHLRVQGKGGREGLLPMPADVGEAIARYLEHGRPTATDRRLFLRSKAPIRGLKVGSDPIGSIVRYALRRAQVNAPQSGSHQFRHALAVRMLQAGASLPEIGEVLRHRSPQTTSIYARVDISSLRSLALPWPGGVR
ncbi:MAG: tyrosine-type recombinase/integrase [Thioalkalivibrio sp.]|nr:tyrosine-type recombinase/integrase [Thioalkalivibrio sp.]